MNNDNNECENFFDSLDDNLLPYFDMPKESADDFEHGFPILSDLVNIKENYKIIDLLDEGGMKKIFRVQDNKSERTVAMARLKLENSHDNKERFLREARLTASLQHPNIIPIYDIGLTEEKEPFFTMELLKGENLGQIIEKSQTDSAYQEKYHQHFLLEIFARICDAMAYAHSRQVIHLDLKPNNIRIGAFGEVIIIDWGLAKVLNQDEEADSNNELDPNLLNDATMYGAIKGTPGFMAPEQVKRYGLKDKRSDIFSLGAILYNMLTGRIPLEGESLDDLLYNTEFALIADPDNKTVQKVPNGLKALMLKCLSADPEKRYQNIESLRRDLDKYMHGFATEAQGAGFITQAFLLAKRHRRYLLLISLFGIAGLFLTAHYFISIQKEHDTAIRAQKSAEDNLRLLQAEQNFTKALRLDMDKLYQEIAHSDDLSSARSKISLLNDGILREKDAQKKDVMLRRLGILHFVLQEFSPAHESFNKVKDKRLKNWKKFSLLGQKLKGHQDYLNDAQLATLLKKLGYLRKPIIFAMYHQHMRLTKRSDNPQDYLPLATFMLNAINNIWDDPKQIKTIEFHQGHLDLSGRPLRNFRTEEGYGYNVLTPLDIRELDLSYTDFFELVQLKNLTLETLNITGCRPKSLTPTRCSWLKSYGIKNIVFDSSVLQKSEVKNLQKFFNCRDVKKNNK